MQAALQFFFNLPSFVQGFILFLVFIAYLAIAVRIRSKSRSKW